MDKYTEQEMRYILEVLNDEGIEVNTSPTPRVTEWLTHNWDIVDVGVGYWESGFERLRQTAEFVEGRHGEFGLTAAELEDFIQERNV